MSIEHAILQKLMISFDGRQPTQAFLDALRKRPVGGISLFRSLNVDSPAQVRALTDALQSAVREAGHPLLLIGADQEGGQLLAIGEGTTPFPGNLALGAAASTELAFQVGKALGAELAAMGVNVNYAPVCDVIVNPNNPVVGTRSFGEHPQQVAALAAAVTTGLQSAGVAATAKHFPGHGDTAMDSHYGTPTVHHDLDRLQQVELPPFIACMEAGARLVMTGHVALPMLNGGKALPSTLSPAILQGLLRGKLGYEGLIISDALDMGAIEQGQGLVIDTIAAAAAGVDLLVLGSHPFDPQELFLGLLQAAQRGLLDEANLLLSARRNQALKDWLQQQEQPPLEVVGCAEHQALALEVARQAVTVVRDKAGQLPLQLAPSARLVIVMACPQDLTPADTSSYVRPELAGAIRNFHPNVAEFTLPVDPSESQVAGLRSQLRDYDLVIAATINADQHPGQAALVNALLEDGLPVIAVGMRMPYDITAYPAVPTYLCTYSILPPAITALAEALFGRIPITGRLPVSIPDVA